MFYIFNTLQWSCCQPWSIYSHSQAWRWQPRLTGCSALLPGSTCHRPSVIQFDVFFSFTLFWLEKGQNYDSAQRVDLHKWGNWRWAEPWTLNLRMPAQNFRPLKDFDIKKEEMNMWFPGLFCLLTMFSLPVQSQAKPFVKHFQTSWWWGNWSVLFSTGLLSPVYCSTFLLLCFTFYFQTSWLWGNWSVLILMVYFLLSTFLLSTFYFQKSW